MENPEKPDVEKSPDAKVAVEKALKKLSPKQIAAIAIALAAIVAVCALVVAPVIKARSNNPTILTESQLQNVVEINKLSTARSVYKGIAEKVSEDGKVLYHVKYKSDVTAGINMSEISFSIDEDSKTVVTSLPEITINEPEVDVSTLEFFEQGIDADLKEALELCKTDAYEKVSQESDIKNLARENLKNTVKALMEPLLSSKGYRIEWGDEIAAEQAQGESSEQGEAQDQGQEEAEDVQNQ